LSLNTVVQPEGGGGAVPARACGLVATAVTATAIKHPASSTSALKTERARIATWPRTRGTPTM
jgi:hypothetical protein